MAVTRGTKLGPYEILAPLGQGGMGDVHRAHDPRLGRDVAIKVLPGAFSSNPDRLARFRREAQALAALNHSGIAAIYGLEEADGAPFLVLELVDGETLAARLARGAIPLRESMALAVQIASAIEAAHERGIVHRDLKPGNIMITPAGVAKVLDFGLAKSDPGLTRGVEGSESPTVASPIAGTVPGLIVGTVAYMSPEQARGKEVDRRTDVWSFGCVLFECLTGRPAFRGETASDLVARILEREPDWASLPAGTPSRVRELMRRCLRKDAGERPRDMRDVRLELAEVAKGDARAAATHEQSIAVLPFENLSGPDDEYFADGVTDEIVNALAHVAGLRVAARTSCFAFKGKREDLRAVGERLDVATVLEGTVRRAGPRLRITAQLVNAVDGYQLWSERYDREMTDVFEVQEAIAQAIATRLRGTLHDAADHGRARRGTTNLEAYELLLRGRALQSKRGRFLPEAVGCLERAIAMDPRYADALASLSDSYRLMGTFGIAPCAEVMPKAKDLAEKALAIDPELAEAWATIASVRQQFEWDRETAKATWAKALAADPRFAHARIQRALWSVILDEIPADEAIAESLRAVQDDPLNAWVVSMRSYLLGFLGRHEESIAEAERSVEMDRDSFFSHWNVMRGYAWLGRYDRAIELAPALLRESGRGQWPLGTLAWTYGKTGQVDCARAVFDEMEGRSRHEFFSPFWLATAAASAGLEERATHFVRRTVDERDSLVLWGPITPFWDTVRTYPIYDTVDCSVWGNRHRGMRSPAPYA